MYCGGNLERKNVCLAVQSKSQANVKMAALLKKLLTKNILFSFLPKLWSSVCTHTALNLSHQIRRGALTVPKSIFSVTKAGFCFPPCFLLILVSSKWSLSSRPKGLDSLSCFYLTVFFFSFSFLRCSASIHSIYLALLILLCLFKRYMAVCLH